MELLQSLWSYPASLHDTQNAVTQKKPTSSQTSKQLETSLPLAAGWGEKNNPPNKTTTKPHYFIRIQAFRGRLCVDLYFFSTQLKVTFPLKMPCIGLGHFRMHHFHSRKNLTQGATWTPHVLYYTFTKNYSLSSKCLFWPSAAGKNQKLSPKDLGH